MQYLKARILPLPDVNIQKKHTQPYPQLATSFTERTPKRWHPILDAFKFAEHGQLSLVTPDGQSLVFGENNVDRWDLRARMFVHNWKALDALLSRGEIGFAEAYMAGLWDSDDLVSLMEFGLLNADVLERYFYGEPLHVLWMLIKNRFTHNSVSGSKRNIMAHYDLGNEFYELWLDKSMTYSCAIFGNNSNSLSLEEAQQAKYHRILDKLDAKAGDHILEIGCGWGGFAEIAAKEGMMVTSVTISEEQKAYADERIYNAGLSHLVTIKLCDYREVEGQFDHIVSIGMFEHVGKNYWPTYFDTIRKRLKAGGKAMVQTITIDDEILKRTRGKSGFIETYIFPGGVLPSKSLFVAAAEKSGLVCNGTFNFGQDYATTLKHWLKRFNAHESEVRRMGYDESFIRMWRLYLTSCIAAFKTKRTDVMQVELLRV